VVEGIDDDVDGNKTEDVDDVELDAEFDTASLLGIDGDDK
jgi:hypothetical protein